MTEESLGVCRTSDDLRAILRARFAALGVSLETVDHIAGLPTRYTAKVIGLQPTRRFGQFSLDGLLGAAGVKLVVVEDAEALDRVRSPAGAPGAGRSHRRSETQDRDQTNPRFYAPNRSVGRAQERRKPSCTCIEAQSVV